MRFCRTLLKLLVRSFKKPAGRSNRSEVLAAVHQVARGHTFYTYAVWLHVIESVSLLQKPLDAATVQEAFTLETLGTNGRIYNLCRYFLEQSLKDVRGDSMPQAILQFS